MVFDNDFICYKESLLRAEMNRKSSFIRRMKGVKHSFSFCRERILFCCLFHQNVHNSPHFCNIKVKNALSHCNMTSGLVICDFPHATGASPDLQLGSNPFSDFYGQL